MDLVKLNIIVAYCDKNGIGLNNDIPWKIMGDLKHFKNITTTHGETNNIVIMGRNTWESIPHNYRPLSNRYNFVLSSKVDFIDSHKVDFIGTSFENIIKYINSRKDIFYDSKIFIIGGEMLYKHILDEYILNIDKLYITEIYEKLECDRFFPKIDNNVFKIKDVSEFKKENNIFFRYFTYEKKINNDDTFINMEELNYKNMIKNILENGLKREDRTGVGTLSVFAPYSMKYDLRDTFPLCTLKRGFLRAVFEELMLYIRGQTDNNILKEKNIHIWDGNTTREFLDKRGLTHLPEGDMGETYGFNMRHYGGTYINCKSEYGKNGFDQLKYVINEIKNNPHSRRILINLWNPKTTCNAALPSCLHQYQFYVDTEKKTLSVQIYLRSSDVFLANNWNVCTGALFVYLLCNLEDINLTPGEITMVCGDAHIYKNHIELAEKMIERESYPYPKLVVLNKKNKIEDFMYEDIKLIGYKTHPNDLKGEMAV